MATLEGVKHTKGLLDPSTPTSSWQIQRRRCSAHHERASEAPHHGLSFGSLQVEVPNEDGLRALWVCVPQLWHAEPGTHRDHHRTFRKALRPHLQSTAELPARSLELSRSSFEQAAVEAVERPLTRPQPQEPQLGSPLPFHAISCHFMPFDAICPMAPGTGSLIQEQCRRFAWTVCWSCMFEGQRHGQTTARDHRCKHGSST